MELSKEVPKELSRAVLRFLRGFLSGVMSLMKEELAPSIIFETQTYLTSPLGHRYQF